MRVGLTERLTRGLVDTLPRRLMLLMWVALVGSHLLAWSLVSLNFLPMSGPHPAGLHGSAEPPRPTSDFGPPPPRAGAAAPQGDRPLPVFPSLPPTPGLSDGPGLSTAALALDYGVRLLLIALAAWLGGRWLTRPLRRLVQASGELVGSLRSAQAPPRLDESSGTREVRQLAAAFNTMAGELQQQFQERALMMAALSHDLRTPLTRLRMRLETQPDGEQLRERAVDDLREMSALIDSVLEVFQPRAQAEALLPLDLGALLQATADDAAELGQAVSLAPLPAAATVRAQPVALRRVIDNLIGNALRYGHCARLLLERDAQGRLLLHIDDEGPGIPDAVLGQVRQAFVRVEASRHRASGGVGLGLYIASQFCAGMDVELKLHNRAEGGLRASLLFPA